MLNDRVSTGAVRTIKEIDDKKAECFITQNSVDFVFFLPLDKVKEDKPKEKRYRPFKTMRELTKEKIKMIKFDDLIQAISDTQAIYVMNKSYEDKGDIDFCSANCGEIYTYGNDKIIADRYAGYIVTDITTNPFKGCNEIKNIKECIYITICNPKGFDC